MFHQSSKQILPGIFVALLLLTMPVYAVKNVKISNYGGGHQIWFEAEDYDERIPDEDRYYAVVDKAGAFGQAITRDASGGMIRWTFDISKADGKGGTWHFWGRILNPDNRSDYMLVEGHPGDPEIPTGPPFPGGSSVAPFVDDDDMVFEQTLTDWGWWGNEDGSDKVLQDGQNTMYIFERQGNTTVFWDVFMWADSPDYVPTDEDYQNATIPVPGKASNPSPANGATDVPRDVVLNWMPGPFAAAVNGHTVYFSESFDDVNTGIGGVTQSTASYAPLQRLDFSKTYYWRVDEVNGPPDFTIFKGKVWQFTVEPFTYLIAGTSITATASSQFSANTGPQNTINGSGLDAGDLHSTAEAAIWLSSMTGPQPTWIQYEFNKVCKLYQMWVWNHNTAIEPALGFGVKDATIEYSVDGANWATLGTTHEFARATGAAGYAHNTTIDLSGVVAKYVKITANSNWGGILPQYGLSEVRFFYVPVSAREPNPASGAIDMNVDNVTLSWRAGREAAKHNVYFSDSNQAVIDGTAPVTTVSQASYGPLSFNLGKTYYWRVDEVNEAETPTTWQGELWDFATQEYFVVDDFEDYNDFEPDRIFDTWIDGWNVPTNGSQVGSDVPPFAEQAIVHGGKQSMPLSYDNSTTASYSEATANIANLAVGKDWTKYGVKTLSLWFRGDPNNAVTEKMYVKLNGSKVTYDGDASNLARAGWQPWNIELTSFGVNLSNVTELSIGLERSVAVGGKGVVYFDDIRLYSYSRQLVTPVEPNQANLAAHYEFEGNSNDSTGANNGTAMGGPTFVAGKIGQAIALDGVDDKVDCGNSSALDFGTGNWAVSAWIKTTQSGSASKGTVFAKGGDETGGIRYMLTVGESQTGQITLTTDDDKTKVQATSSTVVNDDKWHHVIGLRNGTALCVYVDGVLDGTNTLSAGYDLSGTSQHNAYVGAITDHRDASGQTLQKYFIGLIDDLRIYDYAPSHAEIAWLAGRTKPFDKPF